MNNLFDRLATSISAIVGHWSAFAVMLSLTVIWAVSGPFFGFSNTWQLVANTTTTLITTLMVFIIQSSQNKSDRAVHLKLDELLHAVTDADNRVIDIENKPSTTVKQRKSHITKEANG